MASRPKSALDEALAANPPTENSGRRSVLDREDVHAAMEEWLDRKAAGEKVGTIPWFAENVITARLGVKTGASNVADYMRRKYGPRYAKAVR